MQIRAVTEKFITLDLCAELGFIHRSIPVIGYRPNVVSTTLFDLVSEQPRLLPAVIHVRQLIWDHVEEYFDKPCQVFVEHTSLISWHPGASIGWHHDDNREYLSQRHFSAVLYLNTQGQDFTGGTFSFQSGPPPLHILPAAGTLLVYTADDRNVHRVEEVTAGERLTLTMWFTLDEAFQEDKKVLSQLSATGLHAPGLPETMFLQSPDRDIRLLQLQQFGWQLVEEGNEQQQQQRQQGMHGVELPKEVQIIEEMQQPQPQTCLLLIHNQSVCGGRQVVRFDSLQQAVMAVNMLQWRCPHRQTTVTAIAAAPSTIMGGGGSCTVTSQGPVNDNNSCEDQDTLAGRDSRSSSHSKSQTLQPGAGNLVPHCCSCSCDQQRMLQARQLVQQYLQAGKTTLQQVLPRWLELGALVPGMYCR